MITTRWATREDFDAVIGRQPPVTVQAIAALADGEAYAVIGIARMDGQWVLGSTYRPEFKRWLRHPTALKAVLKMQQIIRQRGVPVIAIADRNEPDSDRLMHRLGFEWVDETDDGGLYRWHS